MKQYFGTLVKFRRHVSYTGHFVQYSRFRCTRQASYAEQNVPLYEVPVYEANLPHILEILSGLEGSGVRGNVLYGLRGSGVQHLVFETSF